MNKKITIGIILGLAVVAGGFWYVQRYIQDDSQEVANSEQEKVEISENENNQENQISTKQLTKEETEKLKKEKDLVWYEIPELGIKFLVTEDTKNDLRYSYKEFRGYRHDNDYLKVKSIMLYSSLETDKNLSNCTLGEEKGWSCGWIQLNVVLKKELMLYKEKNGLNIWCNDGSFKKFEIDNYFGCIVRIRGHIISNDEYQNFFHTPINQNNKNFGIYLNTIQSIK